MVNEIQKCGIEYFSRFCGIEYWYQLEGRADGYFEGIGVSLEYGNEIQKCCLWIWFNDAFGNGLGPLGGCPDVPPLCSLSKLYSQTRVQDMESSVYDNPFVVWETPPPHFSSIIDAPGVAGIRLS